jgi:hypothetical protein
MSQELSDRPMCAMSCSSAHTTDYRFVRFIRAGGPPMIQAVPLRRTGTTPICPALPHHPADLFPVCRSAAGDPARWPAGGTATGRLHPAPQPGDDGAGRHAGRLRQPADQRCPAFRLFAADRQKRTVRRGRERPPRLSHRGSPPQETRCGTRIAQPSKVWPGSSRRQRLFDSDLLVF